jgi:PAS domain S-box-containing protein
MLGYESAEEVLALKLPDDLYVDPAQRMHLRANYEPTGVIEGVEAWWKRKNGEQIVVSLYARTLHNTRGRIVGYEGMVVDVTKQKRMEEALRQSEARYRTVSDLISDYAYAVRIEADGRTVVEWVTDAFSRITGFTMQELEANGGIVRLIHPEDLPSVLQRLSLLLAGQPGISEHRIITKSREVRWLRDYSCPEWEASQGRVIRIIGAGQDITERKQAEEQLHLLSHRLLETQERERHHLARELHDELGQELTGLKLLLQMTKSTSQVVAQRLRNSIKVVDDLLVQVRTLSLDLRPLMLDELGLGATLDWYVQRQAQRVGFVVHLEAKALEPRPHPTIETACFRVVQEALTNVVRHAQACQVWVEVQQHDSALLLHVRDDGIGFDLNAARAQAAQGKGLGLVGMEERVRLAGGQMEIVTEPGRGTEIRARFPLRETL